MVQATKAIGILLIVTGALAFAWIFPFFTLNEPFLTWYGELLFGDSFSQPGGAGAAAPFLWLVTAPTGILTALIGVAVLHWSRGS